METGKRVAADDKQVFLMMGVNEDAQDAQCAIVMARDLPAAKEAFNRTYRDSMLMTWPSLYEIRLSIAMMEMARNGGFPEDVMVINDMGRNE